MNTMNHCCTKMDYALNHKKHPIMFSEKTSAYYFKIRYAPYIQCLTFCPWCSTTLTSNQTLNLSEIQKDSTAYNDSEHLLFCKNIFPRFFQNERWWKPYEEYPLPLILERSSKL